VHNGHVITTKAVSVTLANRFRHRFSRRLFSEKPEREIKKEKTSSTRKETRNILLINYQEDFRISFLRNRRERRKSCHPTDPHPSFKNMPLGI
jgi:hypothetical protein